MHWLFLILAALAITFIALGALSVWVAILMVALKALLVVPAVFAIYLLWNFIFGRKALNRPRNSRHLSA